MGITFNTSLQRFFLPFTKPAPISLPSVFCPTMYGPNQQHIKQRQYFLLTKVHVVQTMVFPVVMYIYGSWAIKLSAGELMPLDSAAGEDSRESMGL